MIIKPEIMSRKSIVLEQPKEDVLNHDNIAKLYHFFKRYEYNRPDFTASKIIEKLYPQIDFENLKDKNNSIQNQ